MLRAETARGSDAAGRAAAGLAERILPLSALALGLGMTVFSGVKIAGIGALGSLFDSLLTADSLLFDGFVIGAMFIVLGAFLLALEAR